jgi:4-hydroxy-3-polyprenylbenzoate decarboxylase
MGLDATKKLPEEGFTREWPDVIEMDTATKRKVDAMWPKLGLTPGTPTGGAPSRSGER